MWLVGVGGIWVWLAGGGCGWNLWLLLVGVVVRRYIDFIILLIATPLVSALFFSSIPTFCSFFNYIYNIIGEEYCMRDRLALDLTRCTRRPLYCATRI